MGSFLYMADAHIKARTWTNTTSLRGDAYEALHSIIRQLKDMNAFPLPLVIGGDWFDSNRPTSADLVETFDFFSHFSCVYYIQGNHDNVNPSYMEAVQEVTDYSFIQSINMQWAYIGTACIRGIAWTPDIASQRTWLNAQHADSHKLSFYVMHTTFRHLFSRPDTEYMEFSDIPEAVKNARSVLLVGHIHTRDTHKVSDTCYVHSPGALYPLNTEEMGKAHAVSLIDTDTGVITDIHTDVRHYETIQFSNVQTLDAQLDTIISNNKMPLPPCVIVVLSGDQELKGFRKDGCVVCIRRSQDDINDTVQLEIADCTMDDAIQQELSDDPDLAAKAVQLYHAEDPVAEISGWLDFWKVERIQ